MKSRILYLTAVLLLFIQILSASTSVIVGKDASADGSVLFGHNQDEDGRSVVNVWYVSRAQHVAEDSVCLFSGIKIAQVDETWGYLWFQMNGRTASDVYMNEWAVTIAGNTCRSRLDSSMARGMIGYMLPRIVAERAQSAREGVRMAGMFLDSLGYSDYGQTLVICDPNEAWIISMPGGRYWAAKRVPDNGMAVFSDQFVLTAVDFKKDKNRMFSKADIVELAVKQGWIEPTSAGISHFSKLFSETYQDDLRQWRGQQLLSNEQDSIMHVPSGGFPDVIRSKNKASLKDVMALLRDQNQGTVYEEIAGGNPNLAENRTICNSATQYSVVAQLRNWLPWPASGLLWVSFGRPDCHPYLPWYTAVDSVSAEYRSTTRFQSPDSARTHHFDSLPGTFVYDPRSAFWIQNELENIIDMDYQASISVILPVRQAIENRLIDFQDEFESSMLRLWKKEPDSARRYCRELIQSGTDETLQKSIRMIRHLKGVNFK